MVKISTLFYVFNNAEGEVDEVFEPDESDARETGEFADVRDYLDSMLIEADRKLVEKLLLQLP